MFHIDSIKKRLLLRLMKVLGFGGFAAYCIASCSNPASNKPEPTGQDVIKPSDESSATQPQNATPAVAESNQEQAPVQDEASPTDTTVQEINTDSPANTDTTANDTAGDANDPHHQTVLSDDEIAELLKSYKEVKTDKYTTKILDEDAPIIEVLVTSKIGNMVIFPKTFKTIVQDSKGDYKVVFSDGTIDPMPEDFFDNRIVLTPPSCDKRYSCPWSPPQAVQGLTYDKNNKTYKQIPINTVFLR